MMVFLLGSGSVNRLLIDANSPASRAGGGARLSGPSQGIRLRRPPAQRIARVNN